MVLDADPEDLSIEIGHDGVAQPYHIQEMIDCALARNRTLTPIEREPTVTRTPEQKNIQFTYGNALVRLEEILEQYDAIIIVTNTRDKLHAVAWDHVEEKAYDPTGAIWSLCDLQIREAWILI